MKTVVEIHVLQNFAPSNLNRDDTGAPKDAMFGGFRRARVSSQCQKRAVREFFRSSTDQMVAERTKRIVGHLSQKILRNRAKEDPQADTVSRMVEAAIKSLGTKDKNVKVDKDGKTDVLLYLSPKEIDALEEVILTSEKELCSDKVPQKTVKQLLGAIGGTDKARLSIDVALFGRMLAVLPEKNQNAACQVSHAISTHTVDREFDFYTAVDDLKPEDTSGADMMGTVEFNSACFYRYAVVDWEKLVDNLQSDAELAKKGVRAFLDGFVVAEPTGKQNTFAAHNRPKFVAVSVRRNTGPQSLTNAFELPVRAGRSEAITKASAEALVSEAKTLNTAYGNHGPTRVLNPIAAEIDGFGEAVTTLESLLDWVVDELSGE